MSKQAADFSQGSVRGAVLRMAAPMTLAQLINILYNIVDRVFIGQIPVTGRLELTGLGLCLPIISIIMGFANLCGVGGGSLFSIHRGEGDDDECRAILGNSFALLILLGVAVTAVLLTLREPLLWLFGASEDTFGYANDYLTIYLCGTLFVMISLGMNPFINAQGFATIGMLTVALGAAINLILDPILIFLYGMGVRGAALATIIAQGCSALWVLRFLTAKTTPHRLTLAGLRLKARRVQRIFALGLSGFFMNLTNSLVQIVCNATLQTTGGDLYVGVMTVVNSLREVIFLFAQGLNNGAQPVMGYNYGARLYGRVRQTIRFSVSCTVGYAVCVWLVTMLLPGQLIRIFNGEEALIEAGIPAMRIYFCMFLFMSLQIAGQTVFTALGRSKNAVFFSLFRKAIINAPLTVLLAHWMGSTGVFTAEAISQFVGGLACFTTMCLTVYRPLSRLEDGEALPIHRHHLPQRHV
ncbi:MAG: MATE family efflux transporter [Clostridiales bacterium]|nr:MATE family efflux transporter [Clostridiales bacterium]